MRRAHATLPASTRSATSTAKESLCLPLGNCLRLYCRWPYRICVDGPALEDFDATKSINVWLSDSELPSRPVTLTTV